MAAKRGEAQARTMVIWRVTPSAKGARYVARAVHANKGDRDKHEAMGFFDGWTTVISQIERVAQSLQS